LNSVTRAFTLYFFCPFTRLGGVLAGSSPQPAELVDDSQRTIVRLVPKSRNFVAQYRLDLL
jgi:hypothetical protein